MMNQETLNFNIITTIQEEFDTYRHMMKTLSSLILMSSVDLDFSEDDRMGISFLMDHITDSQARIFEEAKTKVAESPEYTIHRAERIISVFQQGARGIGDVDEVIQNLKWVIDVFGQAYPEAPELLEKLERISNKQK